MGLPLKYASGAVFLPQGRSFYLIQRESRGQEKMPGKRGLTTLFPGGEKIFDFVARFRATFPYTTCGSVGNFRMVPLELGGSGLVVCVRRFSPPPWAAILWGFAAGPLAPRQPAIAEGPEGRIRRSGLTGREAAERHRCQSMARNFTMAVRQRAEAPARCPFRGDILNQTNNYQLSQWDSDDRILRTDFNADNAKVDAALADQASSVTALAGQLATKGNCQIYFTSYEGDGTYGTTAKKTYTFAHRPLLIIVAESGGTSMCAIRGMTTAYRRAISGVYLKVSWDEKSVSWWHTEGANSQMNNSGTTYYLMALLDLDQ